MSAGSEKLPALTHTAHADCREKNAVGERNGVRRRREGEEGGGERERKEEERGRGKRRREGEEGGGGGRRLHQVCKA